MNPIGRKEAIRMAMKAALDLKLDPKNTRPHDLYLFAQLTSSKDSYTLKLDNDSQKKVISIAEGLQDRDSFMAVAYSLGILRVPIYGGTEYPAAGRLVYFADPNVFSTAATVTLSESEQVNHVYWGRHTLQTNEGIRINEARNLQFMTVQETQGSASTLNMLTGMELKEIGAVIRFAGGDNNQIITTFDCEDKSLIGGPATHNNYLFWRLCGAIIKGATNKSYLG